MYNIRFNSNTNQIAYHAARIKIGPPTNEIGAKTAPYERKLKKLIQSEIVKEIVAFNQNSSTAEYLWTSITFDKLKFDSKNFDLELKILNECVGCAVSPMTFSLCIDVDKKRTVFNTIIAQ